MAERRGWELGPAPAGTVPAGGQERAGSFPLGEEWEVTEENAGRWYAHGFTGRRGDSTLFRRCGAVDSTEIALLIFDLCCYEGLVARYERRQGPKPPPLPEYLRPGREAWGEAARLARELRALRAAEEGRADG